MNKLVEMIKIADIHVSRINTAIDELNLLIPFDGAKIKAFTIKEIMLSDLIVNRFGKLQDLIGQKIIDVFLEEHVGNVDTLTIIDKLNKLERLEIIDDVGEWNKLRIARNHAAHEYPDHPELTARHLNEIIKLAPKLIDILSRLRKKAKL